MRAAAHEGGNDNGGQRTGGDGARRTDRACILMRKKAGGNALKPTQGKTAGSRTAAIHRNDFTLHHNRHSGHGIVIFWTTIREMGAFVGLSRKGSRVMHFM